MHKNLKLQDTFLNTAKKENTPVMVYLVNGIKLQGKVKGFDSFTLFLEYEGKIQMVYKHAITTIMPAKNLKANFLKEAFENTQNSKDEILEVEYK